MFTIDYDILEVSSDSGGEGDDEHGTKRRKLDDQKEYIPMTPYIIAGSGKVFKTKSHAP